MADESDERMIRHGRNLFKVARDLGWNDDEAEGPIEWIMRKCREQALIDALDNHWHLDVMRKQREQGKL